MLRIGTLGLSGLTLADLCRLRAQASAGTATTPRCDKSVIMIWLRGGPSHIDSFDMKPQAPAEIRGEFAPISTNVPGIEICEHLPLTAGIMDKLAIIRGIRSNDLGDHTPHYIATGFADRGKRPTVGSIVSYLRPRTDGLPPYVSAYTPEWPEGPTYLGPAHQAFVPRGEGFENLRENRDLPAGRLYDRHQLLSRVDAIRREVDQTGTFAALDEFSTRAIDMLTTPAARVALNLDLEPAGQRERYGRFGESFLLARRLVEAGVNVVTLKIGDWDTHEHNFRDMRDQLPELDRGFHSLVADLHDRGLDKQVAVVMWGEFGRAPRISRIAGRDHWPEAGAAVMAGGGFRTGQIIGATDSQAGQSVVQPYTPGNVIASLYRHLEIDTTITIPDHNLRPMYVLDEREIVREL
jgi:hypothetical protein